jgi:hypothetical protein
MKKIIFMLFIMLLPSISYAGYFADIFMDDPILKNAKSVEREEGRITFTTEKSHDEVLSFYREKLKSFDDIKYRDWGDATYIEDDGRMPWHSITISKDMNGHVTTVVIAKDNWKWIMGTLVLRYVAVFVVLLVLFIGMKVSGAIISSTVNKPEVKKA